MLAGERAGPETPKRPVILPSMTRSPSSTVEHVAKTTEHKIKILIIGHTNEKLIAKFLIL